VSQYAGFEFGQASTAQTLTLIDSFSHSQYSFKTSSERRQWIDKLAYSNFQLNPMVDRSAGNMWYMCSVPYTYNDPH